MSTQQMNRLENISKKKIWNHGNIPGFIQVYARAPLARKAREMACCLLKASPGPGSTALTECRPHLQWPPCAMELSLQEATSQPYGLKHSGPHVCSQFHTCVYLGNDHVYSLLTDYSVFIAGPPSNRAADAHQKNYIRVCVCVCVCVCVHTHTGPQLLK